MSLRNQLETYVRGHVGAFVQHTLARTPLTPNMITLLGVALTIASAVLVAQGHMLLGGIVLAIGSVFDMLDGALARARQQSSQLGAFIDSCFDRYSDALILLGLLVFYQRTAPQSVELTLTFVAALGALLTSYTRARAEALGFGCKVGLLERPERLALIVVGLWIGWLGPMLWALAVLTHITAAQRIWHVWQSARAKTVQHNPSPSA